MLNRLFSILSKQTIFRHLAAWLLIVIYYIFYSKIEGSILVKTAWIFLLIINYSFAYYTLVLFIWPKILSEKKLLYSILILFSVTFFCSFFYFQLTIIIPQLGGMHPMIYWPFNVFINNALKLYLYIFFTSIGTYNNWIGLKEIKEDQKINRDIIEMEFIFLKNQFHSHLTFNFLNFCYNRVRIFSPPSANSIEEFADILRYSLTTSPDRPVLLEKEIGYIENYISFQKFLNPNLKAQLNYKGDITSVYILPKTFGFFVEYFFKNKLFHPPTKTTIILIESSKSEVVFNIKNIKKELNIFINSEELQNIEQILQSFYGSQHSLQLQDNDEFFSCDLKLQKAKNNYLH
jgi:hypothetical protein